MTRPPRLVGICYPVTIFGRNLPLGDLPTVHCRLRVLRPPFHRSRSVEQHGGNIAHIVAEGIVARLDLRLWDNIVAISRTSWPKVSWRGWICAFGTSRVCPAGANSAVVWSRGRVHSGGRERLAAVAEASTAAAESGWRM